LLTVKKQVVVIYWVLYVIKQNTIHGLFESVQDDKKNDTNLR